MNNLVCFIPARGQSKGIPRKNIKLLGGKPLIAWTIDTAFDAGLTRIIVSTDDVDIKKISQEHRAEVLDRSAELAQDKTSMYEVLKSEIPKLEPKPDWVLLLHPTVPFRKKLHIQLALTVFNADMYDSLISASRIPNKYHPDEVIVRTPVGIKMASGIPIAQRKTNRQSYTEAWVPDGSVYLFKTENLNKGSIYGLNTMILEVEEGLNLNTIEDWEKAEQYLKQKNYV